MSDHSWDFVRHGQILVSHCLVTDRYLQSCCIVFWARQFTLTAPLYTHENKEVPASCFDNMIKCYSKVADSRLASHRGPPPAVCLRKVSSSLTEKQVKSGSNPPANHVCLREVSCDLQWCLLRENWMFYSWSLPVSKTGITCIAVYLIAFIQFVLHFWFKQQPFDANFSNLCWDLYVLSMRTTGHYVQARQTFTAL